MSAPINLDLSTPTLTLATPLPVNVKKKIFKAKYYKFPSSEERQTIAIDIQQFERFKFEYISLLHEFFNKKSSIKKAHSKDNLYHWNVVLSNRLGKLSETQLFLTTHFERGFQEDYLECENEELVDKMLFNYFSEIFYYFYFSSLDTIAHILNHFFNLNIKQNNVSFNHKLFSKIENKQIRQKIIDFYNSLDDTKEFRNSFTHRFPKNEKDFRSKIEEIDKLSVSKGIGEITSTLEILRNIKDSANSLNMFLKELKVVLEKETE